MNINSTSLTSSTSSSIYSSAYQTYKYYNRISGLASGLDTDSIVQGLMSIEKAKYNKLYQQQQLLKWQQEQYQSIASDISSFRDYIFNLKLSSNFVKFQTTGEAVDSGYIQAVGTANALEGTYQVNVKQLATPAAIVVGDLKAKFTSSYSGSLPQNVQLEVQLNVGGTVTIRQITVSLDSSTTESNFGSKVASALNSALKNDGVYAYYDSTLDKLILSTRQTGSNIMLTLNNANNISTTAASSISKSGQDAKIDIIDKFGNETLDVTSSTNTFNLYGISITVNKVTSGYKTFSISKDVDAVVNNIKDFISKYNDLVSKIYSKITEKRNRDYQPLTEDQKAQMKDEDIQKWEAAAQSGLLNGDSILSGFLQNMRKLIYEPLSSLPSNINQLTDIGIDTYSYFESKEGKLYIKDEAKLREAISDNFDSFVNLFTSTGASGTDKGILQKIYDTAKTALDNIYSKAGKSSTYYDSSEIGKQLKSISDQMTQEQERLQEVEDRYYRQFTQLETLISQMNTQSAWLSQQFGG